jgi:hypothetical protein
LTSTITDPNFPRDHLPHRNMSRSSPFRVALVITSFFFMELRRTIIVPHFVREPRIRSSRTQKTPSHLRIPDVLIRLSCLTLAATMATSRHSLWGVHVFLHTIAGTRCGYSGDGCPAFTNVPRRPMPSLRLFGSCAVLHHPMRTFPPTFVNSLALLGGLSA